MNWYLSAGQIEGNVAFAIANAASISGAYLCCNAFSFNATGDWVAGTPDERVANETAPLRALGLSPLMYVIGVAQEAIYSGSWARGIEDAVATAARTGIDGFIVDYEPVANYTRAHAEAYAAFLAALGTALHANASARLRLGFDVAGWSILDQWEVYATLPVDIFTSMTPTYFGTNQTANRDFISGEVAGGVPAAAISAGIGSMLAVPGTAKWDYNWTQGALTDFLTWLPTAGVTGVDVWRADIDGYGYTADWFLDGVAAFLAGGSGAGEEAGIAPPPPAAAAAAPPSPAALLAAIAAAIAAGQPSYTVPPGVYNFSTLPQTVLSFSAPHDFTLSAQGATFLIRPGQGFSITDAVNSSFLGFTVDTDPLFFTQGVVSRVSRAPDGYVTYDLAVEAGYPSLDEPIFQQEGTRKTIFWDAPSRTIFHQQVQTTTAVHNLTALGGGVWRVVTWMGGVSANFTPPEGCLGTISPVLAPAILAVNCSGLLVEDVTLHGSSAMGYLEMGGAGGSTLRRWNATRAPGTTRLLATSLDGVHSTSVAAGMTLVDSEVSFAADDLFAVHCELGIAWGAPPDGAGASLYIIDTGGAQARTVANLTAGDALSFFELSETMDPMGTATVAAVSVVANATLQAEAAAASADIAREKHITVRDVSSAALLLRMDFAAPLPPAFLPRFAAMVQSDARCGRGTRVVNTSLHDTTGGMRLKGVDVTVQGCALSRAYGMRMLPEVFWTQSVSVNVTIEDNVFTTTGHAPAAPDSIAYTNDTCPGLVLRNNTFLP